MLNVCQDITPVLEYFESLLDELTKNFSRTFQTWWRGKLKYDMYNSIGNIGDGKLKQFGLEKGELEAVMDKESKSCQKFQKTFLNVVSTSH